MTRLVTAAEALRDDRLSEAAIAAALRCNLAGAGPLETAMAVLAAHYAERRDHVGVDGALRERRDDWEWCPARGRPAKVGAHSCLHHKPLYV